ncbi:MAG: hypothetical protein V4490_05790, partial [Pseudomonadota bacterium]
SIANMAKSHFDQVTIYADRNFHQKPEQQDGVCVKAVLNNFAIKKIKPLVNQLFYPLSLLKKEKKRKKMNDTILEEVPSTLITVGKKIQSLDLYFSIKKILKEHLKPTNQSIHILIQHCKASDIMAIRRLIHTFNHEFHQKIYIHLIIREEKDFFCGTSSEFHQLESDLRLLIQAKNIHVSLLADTQLLCNHYQSITGAKNQFNLFPALMSANIPPIKKSPEDANNRKLRLSILGTPRLEKGLEETIQLIHDMNQCYHHNRMVLCVQVDAKSSDGAVQKAVQSIQDIKADNRQQRYPLELLKGPAPTELYFSWLANTDILLMPYTSRKYQFSSSGIFMEGIHFAIPSVVPKDTWMASLIEKAKLKGLKIGEVADSITDFPEKIDAILSNIERYQGDMATFRENWHAFNNSDTLIQTLLQPERSAENE